jgi:hypothetical protein
MRSRPVRKFDRPETGVRRLPDNPRSSQRFTCERGDTALPTVASLPVLDPEGLLHRFEIMEDRRRLLEESGSVAGTKALRREVYAFFETLVIDAGSGDHRTHDSREHDDVVAHLHIGLGQPGEFRCVDVLHKYLPRHDSGSRFLTMGSAQFVFEHRTGNSATVMDYLQ